jgi:hypothetical protein
MTICKETNIQQECVGCKYNTECWIEQWQRYFPATGGLIDFFIDAILTRNTVSAPYMLAAIKISDAKLADKIYKLQLLK